MGEGGPREGAKAPFSRPTGETPRLLCATSNVFACRMVGSSAEVTESARLAWAESTESSVSEAMRGEDSVRRPACDWCGDMPGRFSGGLQVG